VISSEKRAHGVVIAPAGGTNVSYNVHQQTNQYGQMPMQYGQPQPANNPYGYPAQPGYSGNPQQPPPPTQDPPVYPGQPQSSSDPAYPPVPAPAKY
jgi:hypothetical protein